MMELIGDGELKLRETRVWPRNLEKLSSLRGWKMKVLRWLKSRRLPGLIFENLVAPNTVETH